MQMEGVWSAEGRNLPTRNCHFDDIIPGQVVYTAWWQELLSGAAVVQDLQQDRDLRRLECGVVNIESEIRLIQNREYV